MPRRWPLRISTLSSTVANLLCCWAPRAAARRPCCRYSVVSWNLLPVESRSVRSTSRVCRLPDARPPRFFRDYALFPHMSVAANVSFGLEMQKVGRPERQARVSEVLAMVGLSGFERRRVDQLSGGQRQRVALARSIAVRPEVLLLDEPLGALDLNLRRQMQDELVGLQRQLGTTFVHVTHDQDEGMSIADTIVVLNNGHIEDRGPPDRVYLKPATLFAATFMGESNILTAKVIGASGNETKLATPLSNLVVEGTASVGSEVHLSIRPEHLGLEAADDTESLGCVVVIDTVFQGAHRRCHVRSVNHGETELLVHIPVEQEIATGDELEVHVRQRRIVLLAD